MGKLGRQNGSSSRRAHSRYLNLQLAARPHVTQRVLNNKHMEARRPAVQSRRFPLYSVLSFPNISRRPVSQDIQASHFSSFFFPSYPSLLFLICQKMNPYMSRTIPLMYSLYVPISEWGMPLRDMLPLSALRMGLGWSCKLLPSSSSSSSPLHEDLSEGM